MSFLWENAACRFEAGISNGETFAPDSARKSRPPVGARVLIRSQRHNRQKFAADLRNIDTIFTFTVQREDAQAWLFLYSSVAEIHLRR